MSASANSVKKNLETATMYRSEVFYKLLLIRKRVFWSVDNFKKLNNDTKYSIIYEPYNWTFSLIRKRESLTLLVDVKKSTEVVLSATVYRITEAMYTCAVKQCRKGIYKTIFPIEVTGVYNFMKENFLLFQFNLSQVLTMNDVSPSSNKQTNDDYICMLFNLLDSYHTMTKLTTDFTLRGDYYAIPVHKYILAARSTFFLKYLKEHPNKIEFKVGMKCSILGEILKYIYTGEIKLDNTWDRTQSIFDSAVALGVTGLQNLLTTRLQTIINFKNVQNIKELGIRNKVETLVEAAEDFLNA